MWVFHPDGRLVARLFHDQKKQKTKTGIAVYVFFVVVFFLTKALQEIDFIKYYLPTQEKMALINRDDILPPLFSRFFLFFSSRKCYN